MFYCLGAPNNLICPCYKFDILQIICELQNYTGHAVTRMAEALREKMECRGFDSLEFFTDIILPAAVWLWGRFSL